jgi:hypothetical protein
MAIQQPILPFPADIDRNHFASWLSGFVDGEGCFFMGISHCRRNIKGILHSLSITLRNDDIRCLQLIQSFFQCGHINPKAYRRNKQNPGTNFRISSAQSLAEIVIPHFDKYPLIAKKKRDYEIWKQGIQLCHVVRLREFVYLKKKSGKRSKWTPDEWERIQNIVATLRETRMYRDQPILGTPGITIRPIPKQPDLFNTSWAYS